MEQLAQYIESLIFVSDRPITFALIKESLEKYMDSKIESDMIESALDLLIEKYQDEKFAIEIVEINNGYKYMTKGAYHGVVGSYLKLQNARRLSTAALETLSIIAYQQPVTKSEMEAIRGVSCDYSVQKLLEKELIAIAGRSEGPGRPLLYATSEKFMEYFGLKDMSDMPKLKDFKTADTEIGEPAPAEEQAEVMQQLEGAVQGATEQE